MSEEEDTDFNQMIDAFYSTEEAYLSDLDTLNHLRLRLLTHNKRDDPILDEDEINQVFLNSGSIFEFNTALLRRLNRMRWKGEEYFIVNVGGLLVKDIQFFKMYGQFIEHVRAAEHRFKDLCQRNSKFKRFVDFHEDLYQKHFSALLYAPLHHLPQYIQTFGELHQALCAINHPAQDNMLEAVNKMQEVMDAISEQAAATKRSNKVVEIQRKLGNNAALVAASRQAYRHATVKIKDQKQSSSVQTAELVLFNDCVIYFTTGFFGTSLRGVMQIAGLEITPIKSQNNTFRLFNELTQREWEVITLEDREYIPWIANLMQVYKRYYGIYDGNDKRIGPQHSNTMSLKVLHPDDFEAEIRNKSVPNPRYKDKPSPITQALAQEILDERRRDRQQAAAAASDAPQIITASEKPLHIPTPASSAVQDPLTPVNTATQAVVRPQLRPPAGLTVNTASTSTVRKLTDDEIWQELAGYEGWERLYDENNKAYYFENTQEQITQWEAPEVLVVQFNLLRRTNDEAVAASITATPVAIPAKPHRPVPPTPSSAAVAPTTTPVSTRPVPATPPRRPSFIPSATTPGTAPVAQPPRPPKRDAPAVPPSTPLPPAMPPTTPSSTSHQLQPPALPTTASQDVAAVEPTPAVVTPPQPPAQTLPSTQPEVATTATPPPTATAPPPRPAFLASIAGGAPSLKKVESDEDTPSRPAQPPAGGLLGAIKGGVTLKKVTDEDRAARTNNSGGGIALASNLQKSLANYRKFVQDDDDDDDDDDDW